MARMGYQSASLIYLKQLGCTSRRGHCAIPETVVSIAQEVIIPCALDNASGIRGCNWVERLCCLGHTWCSASDNLLLDSPVKSPKAFNAHVEYYDSDPVTFKAALSALDASQEN